MSPFYIYYIVVTTVSFSIILIGLRALKVAEKKRLASAKKMDVSEAVKTEALDEDIESISRNHAVSSIEARFGFIRKTFVPLVLVVTGFLLALPLLPALSAAYVSLAAGALTVLFGIAAKPFLENAISGVVITLSQPIRIGDTVIMDGKYGNVEKINLLYTVIKIWNWRRYIVPNHKLLQKEFENLSREEESEWTHIEFTVAPGTNLDLVKKLAKEAMQSRHLMKTEPPSVWIMEIRSDVIVCWVAGWASCPADAWALRSSTRQRLAMFFREHSINYHMVQNTVELNRHPLPQQPDFVKKM